MNRTILFAPNTDHSLIEFCETAEKLSHRMTIIAKAMPVVPARYASTVNVINQESLSEKMSDYVTLDFSSAVGIIPGSEFVTTICDDLARMNHLFCNQLNESQVFRNKRVMRDFFLRAGIRQPRVLAIIHNLEALKNLDWSKICFPVIVKPSDMAGSIFVRKCNTVEDAVLAATPIYSYTQSQDTGIYFETTVLLEEYVAGEEYSAECIVHNGELKQLFMVRKVVSDFPYCDEIGHITGFQLDAEAQNKVEHLVRTIIQSTKIMSSVLHVEFKLFNQDPYIIEVGNRVAGGRISKIIKLAYDVSLEEVFYRIRCGLFDGKAIPINAAKHEVIGIRFRYNGIKQKWHYHDVNIIEALMNLQGEIKQHPNTHGLYFNGNRAGYDIFRSSRLDQAIHFIQGK